MESINSRSEEVQNILNHTPKWVLRWGITVFFLFLSLLVFLTFIIKYPEVVPGKIVLTGGESPVKVVARASGHLKLFIRNNEKVESDQVVAMVDNSIDLSHIHLIRNHLLEPDPVEMITINGGELQQQINQFNKSLSEILDFQGSGLIQSKISDLRRLIKEYRPIQQLIQSQILLKTGELKWSEKRFLEDSTLFFKGAITALEFDVSRQRLANVSAGLQSLKASLLENRLQEKRNQSELRGLEIQYEIRKNELQLNFHLAREQLASAVELWEQKYLLVAPKSGKTSFHEFLSENQFVISGHEVMSVVADQKTILKGKVLMPILNSGKVEAGYNVNVKLHGYPYKEYGFLRGVVESIALIPNENQYAVFVVFPEGLETTYEKKIDFKDQMQGDVEIITEDVLLIERIFYHFKDLFVNKSI